MPPLDTGRGGYGAAANDTERGRGGRALWLLLVLVLLRCVAARLIEDKGGCRLLLVAIGRTCVRVGEVGQVAEPTHARSGVVITQTRQPFAILSPTTAL